MPDPGNADNCHFVKNEKIQTSLVLGHVLEAPGAKFRKCTRVHSENEVSSHHLPATFALALD